jgi:hypothetical protein
VDTSGRLKNGMAEAPGRVRGVSAPEQRRGVVVPGVAAGNAKGVRHPPRQPYKRARDAPGGYLIAAPPHWESARHPFGLDATLAQPPDGIIPRPWPQSQSVAPF